MAAAQSQGDATGKATQLSETTTVSLEEYKLYFDNTPNGHLYRQEYVSFLKEDIVGSEIISSDENVHLETANVEKK